MKMGYLTLFYNSTGDNNTAIGSAALTSNTTGTNNAAHGYEALSANTTGFGNTATGAYALRQNTEGLLNTAIGTDALLANTTGDYNTSIGGKAGGNNTSGGYNTFLGFNADASTGTLKNATAIGANATVNAGNKVRIGDASVTVIEGQVAYSSPSDRRLKENIVYTTRLWPEFINRLQTVSYTYISDKTKTRYDGFIAQDIEAIPEELNVPFSGLKKANDAYSLAYTDFIMPLVNAVKEQQKKIESLEQSIKELKQRP